MGERKAKGEGFDDETDPADLRKIFADIVAEEDAEEPPPLEALPELDLDMVDRWGAAEEARLRETPRLREEEQGWFIPIGNRFVSEDSNPDFIKLIVQNSLLRIAARALTTLEKSIKRALRMAPNEQNSRILNRLSLWRPLLNEAIVAHDRAMTAQAVVTREEADRAFTELFPPRPPVPEGWGDDDSSPPKNGGEEIPLVEDHGLLEEVGEDE